MGGHGSGWCSGSWRDILFGYPAVYASSKVYVDPGVAISYLFTFGGVYGTGGGDGLDTEDEAAAVGADVDVGGGDDEGGGEGGDGGASVSAGR